MARKCIENRFIVNKITSYNCIYKKEIHGTLNNRLIYNLLNFSNMRKGDYEWLQPIV